MLYGGRQVNIKIWCKSFLSIYHIIPSVIASIDKLVYLKSVNSSEYSLESKLGTQNQIENIMKLTQRKVNLINLKVLTDQTLLEMDKKKSKLLILKYIDNVKSKKAIELSGLNRRTYFRALNSAFGEFESLFYLKILKSNNLYLSLKEEGFLDDIFNKIDLYNKAVENKGDELENTEKFTKNMCSIIIKKLRKVF